MKKLSYIALAALLLTALGCNQTKPTPDTTLIGVASSNRLLELSQVVLNSAGALDTATQVTNIRVDANLAGSQPTQ